MNIRFLLLSLLLPLLTGCQRMILLHPAGPIARDEQHILLFSACLILIVVIPVIVLTIAFVWRYRASNPKATYAPNWAHSVPLEVVWWSIPCIIIAILATLTWMSSHALDPYRPLDVKQKPLTVQVISLQWKWLFIYPEQKIATLNALTLPVDVPVQFLITAEGPMNAFFIPQLGSQIYAMAGMRTRLNLIAEQTGEYRGMGANITGDGFSGMHFVATVVSKDAFNQWVASVKSGKQVLSARAYAALITPSENVPIQSFSSVDGAIFENAIMKAR